MKLAVRIAQIVVVLSLLVAAAGFLLPSKQTVTRSIVIDAPPQKILPHLAGAKAFQRWSPWVEMEPDLDIFWFGPEQGKGSGMKWESARSGEGSWTVTDVVDDRRVDIAMTFGAGSEATAWFDLEPAPGGTRVIWGFSTEAGMNPIHRWFGLMLDDWVGKDFEKGLRRLKRRIEGGADIPV